MPKRTWPTCVPATAFVDTVAEAVEAALKRGDIGAMAGTYQATRAASAASAEGASPAASLRKGRCSCDLPA